MDKGILYVVSTPIGNLEDTTLRAIRILREVDLIAAEDTRKTKILLNKYNIKKALTSYFNYNEQFKTVFLIDKLKSGEKIALVSEAGTPSISDPGYRLICEAIKESIPVLPVPGVSAAIAALSISGLPVHRFVFEGFLPPKAGKRKNFLKKISVEERTLIFYESPHRIIFTLKDMIEVFGNRKAMLARELTKLHEESMYGSLFTILERLKSRKVKGEITLIVEGNK
jgi:16S rRNA (cytidine1402-2'-O)-methyltransferase